jgi:hypothetical protein
MIEIITLLWRLRRTEVTAEIHNAGGTAFSDQTKDLLGQYNRQTDYARGIGERMIGLMLVFLGFYYGSLKKFDTDAHSTFLRLTVLGSTAVVVSLFFLCLNNFRRCNGSYNLLIRVARDEGITPIDIGIVNDELWYSVWSWFRAFLVIYVIFFGIEVYALWIGPGPYPDGL